MKHVVDGLEDSDIDVLDVLVSDGGDVSPQDVAEETGWHIDTIYRAIDRIEDLVEHSYDELTLRSHFIAERVCEAVQHAREHLTNATETLAASLEQTVGMDLANDALLEWVDGWGIEVDDRRDAQLALRFGRLEMTRNEFIVVLTNGLHEWMRAGWHRDRFLEAEVDVRLQDAQLKTRAEHILH